MTVGDPLIFNQGVNSQSIIAGPGLSVCDSGTWITISSTTENSIKEMSSRIDELEKKLSILVENREAQEKFPALKEAYEAYKIIERLVYDHKSNE
jgi:hypothetical protein